jgi:hypothetical protein
MVSSLIRLVGEVYSGLYGSGGNLLAQDPGVFVGARLAGLAWEVSKKNFLFFLHVIRFFVAGPGL